MLLLELYDPPKKGYQSVERDNTQMRWREFRKSRLTLADLHRINEMLQVRAYEYARDMKQVQDQYGPKAQPMM